MEAFYKICLERELNRRAARNPRYSLRAFARATDVDVSILSKVLARKTLPSKKVADKFLASLDLSETDRTRFIRSIEEQRTLEAFHTDKPDADRQIDDELMEVLSEWHHIAILELTQVNGFRSEPRWIGKALSISELEAKLSIQKLIRCGLLEERDGQLRRLNGMLTTKDKARSSLAHRRRQRQVLERALVALEETPIDERNHSAVTFAIDESKLPEAKRLITEFNRKMAELLESGTQTRTYELSVALFPVQSKETK